MTDSQAQLDHVGLPILPKMPEADAKAIIRDALVKYHESLAEMRADQRARRNTGRCPCCMRIG